jgi:integrase
MDHSTIHDFARAQAHTTTAANLAHRVRRLEILASTVNPGPNALPRVRKTPHAPVSPPYTPTQMRALEQACRAQSAPSATRGLQAIIGFARGAGASSGELLALGRHDVQDLGPDGIHVTLGAGDTRRTVPVRRAYEPWVRAAINALGPNDPVLPTRGKNAVGHILDQVEILSDGVPRIEVARLRTTWIAELMTLPIPLNVLLSAAGLKSARTVSDIYAHLQTPTYAPNDLLRGEAP